MPLDPAVLGAPQALRRALGPDVPMVIVGATVPLVLLDFRQGRSGGRVTPRCGHGGPAHQLGGLCGAVGLNNLGSLYYRQGQYDQAEPLLRRALAIHQKTLGAAHVQIALGLNNLAALYLAREPLWPGSDTGSAARRSRPHCRRVAARLWPWDCLRRSSCH